MELAKLIASWSKDDIGVGAVIVDNDFKIVSIGFNGVPKGVDESFKAFSRAKLHAEQNAILFAKRNLKGYTIIVWPFMPCAICASMIIQSDLARVVVPRDGLYSEKWQEDWDIARAMFDDAGIEVVEL